MDFQGTEMDFQEAERRYAELKRQFDAGTIGMDDFNAKRQRLMVQDDEGHWWARSPSNDEWAYYNGSAWVPGTPPSYQEATPEPTDSPTQALSASHPEGVENGKNGRQSVPPWILVAGVAAIALVGIAFGWALKSYVAGGPALDEQGAGGPALDEQGKLQKRLGRVEGALENGRLLDAAFVHHATPENITDHWTYIDHPLINNKPNAVLYVTPNWNPHGEKHTIHTPHPIGVWYDGNRGRWSIFNEDEAAMAVGAHFNVAVVTNLPQEAMEEGK
jgi:hypothetical protein